MKVVRRLAIPLAAAGALAVPATAAAHHTDPWTSGGHVYVCAGEACTPTAIAPSTGRALASALLNACSPVRTLGLAQDGDVKLCAVSDDPFRGGHSQDLVEVPGVAEVESGDVRFSPGGGDAYVELGLLR